MLRCVNEKTEYVCRVARDGVVKLILDRMEVASWLEVRICVWFGLCTFVLVVVWSAAGGRGHGGAC